MPLSKEEEEIANHVLKAIEGTAELSNNINTKIDSLMEKYKKQRLELFKQFVLISGGAAALMPQIISLVKRRHVFYIGTGLLVLAAMLASAYLVAYVEREVDHLLTEKDKGNSEIKKMRDPRIAFIMKADFSPRAFGRLTEGLKGIYEEQYGKIIPEPSGEPAQEQKMKRLDYSSEYILFIFTIGIGMVILSTTNVKLTFLGCFLSIVGIFILINAFSAFWENIFITLGFPMDYLKHRLRKKTLEKLSVPTHQP